MPRRVDAAEPSEGFGAEETPRSEPFIKERTGQQRKVKKPPRGLRTVEVGDEGLAHDMVVRPVALIANGQVPNPYRLTEEEIDSILTPLERIVLRRLPVDATAEGLSKLDPDKRDFLMAAGGLLGYGTRLYFETGHAASGQRQPTVDTGGTNRTPPPAAHGPRSRGTGDGGANGEQPGNEGIPGAVQVDTLSPSALAEALAAKNWKAAYRGNPGGDVPADHDSVKDG